VRIFKWVAVVCFLSMPAWSQQTGNCNNQSTRQCSDSQTISTSGNTITIPSNGGLVPTFEEVFNGSPATVSVTINGCGGGGTCDLLDTYTTVTNALRAPTVLKAYANYKVAATWTGGTSPSVTVNTTISTAMYTTAGGGGTTQAFSSGGTSFTGNNANFGITLANTAAGATNPWSIFSVATGGLSGPNNAGASQLCFWPGSGNCTVSIAPGGAINGLQLIVGGSTPSAPAGRVALGATTVAATSCGSLASSTGCLQINVGGTNRFLPFY
jgi:hypothetical protein